MRNARTPAVTRAEKTKSKTKSGIRKFSLVMADKFPDTTGQLLPILRQASPVESTPTIVVRDPSRSRANPKLCWPPLFLWSVVRLTESKIQEKEQAAQADPGVAPIVRSIRASTRRRSLLQENFGRQPSDGRCIAPGN